MNDKKLNATRYALAGWNLPRGWSESRVADAPSYGSFLVLVS